MDKAGGGQHAGSQDAAVSGRALTSTRALSPSLKPNRRCTSRNGLLIRVLGTVALFAFARTLRTPSLIPANASFAKVPELPRINRTADARNATRRTGKDVFPAATIFAEIPELPRINRTADARNATRRTGKDGYPAATILAEIPELPRINRTAGARNATRRTGKDGFPAATILAEIPELPRINRTAGARNTTRRTGKDVFPAATMFLDRKLLYCPSAKAGSSSIFHSVLVPAGIVNASAWGRDRCYDDCPISAWRIYDEGDAAVRETLRAAPSFTVVRNPWDRLRSCYEDKIARKVIIPTEEKPHGRVHKKMKWQEKAKVRAMTFVEFVAHVEKYPHSNDHWAPHSTRCRFAADDRGAAFRYDHVLRMEDDLFAQLEDIFGRYRLPFPAAAAPRNVKGHAANATEGDGAAARDRALRDFYAGAAAPAVSVAALVERVGKIYESDVHSHGYAFPWPAR